MDSSRQFSALEGSNRPLGKYVLAAGLLIQTNCTDLAQRKMAKTANLHSGGL